jgi:hypothetical protein
MIRVDGEVFALIKERQREIHQAGWQCSEADAVRSLLDEHERIDPPGYKREAARLKRWADGTNRDPVTDLRKAGESIQRQRGHRDPRQDWMT